MKISIIGPGIMPIPPTGWGAVEILIWDYAEMLRMKGHEVQIVNTPKHADIIAEVNSFDPDFVHLQYDDHIDVMKKIRCNRKAVTSHFGYLDQPQQHGDYKKLFKKFIKSNIYIFCLSTSIIETYKKFGVNEKRLCLTPNAARSDRFKYKPIPEFQDRSIYVAKIDYRKRQHIFQDLNCNIYFVGNCVDKRFDLSSPFYLGEWDKPTLYTNLTDYANLILLSDGEAHALVCIEALMAGLGLVISEFAASNLDLSKKFITVIPENRINDREFVANAIKKNREYSVAHRSEIREYALSNFAYEVVVDNFIKTIENCPAIKPSIKDKLLGLIFFNSKR
jgi:hypothetical protein